MKDEILTLTKARKKEETKIYLRNEKLKGKVYSKKSYYHNSHKVRYYIGFQLNYISQDSKF